MTSTIRPSIPIDSDSSIHNSTWRKVANWLVRRRIRISAIVFVILIAEDVLEGTKPHDLMDFYDAKSMVGFVLIVLGLGIRSWAAGILHKRSRLTTAGPYAVVRHPLYVGSLLIMFGVCALIDDAENIWFVLGPICLVYLFGVLHEERTLAEKFGEQWSEYARSTPRLLPRRLPNGVFADWTLSQWLRNHEYRAAIAVLMGLVAMQVWKGL